MEKFYLVTESVSLIKKLLPVGVKLIQLRIKNMSQPDLRQNIMEAKICCERCSFRTRRFIKNRF